MKTSAWPLICPVCDADLTPVDRSLKCPQGHSFDIAREGYVNLYVSRKRPKIMGDTQEMLRARRDFLDQDHYQPLSDAINVCVYEHLAQRAESSAELSPVCVVDLGCGEGYYLGRLKGYLDARLADAGIRYFGQDFSKQAMRMAAKLHKEARFVVGDIKQKALFANGSVQVLLNVFAPRNPGEFERITAHDGLVLIVIPNPDHLENLRSDLGLLGIEADKRANVVEQLAGVFKLAGEQSLAYDLNLSGQALFGLIQMSPSSWHISQEDMEGLKTVRGVQAKVSFNILQFKVPRKF